MLDKEYIFNASVKLLRNAAEVLDNDRFVSLINEKSKDYKVDDVDVTLPILASTLLLCEGLINDEYIYDIVARNIANDEDNFKTIYNRYGINLIDKDFDKVHNPVFIDDEDLPLDGNAFIRTLFDKIFEDTLNNIRNKKFVDYYKNIILDADELSDYKFDESLLDYYDSDEYSDDEIMLADKIAEYRFDVICEDCKDKDAIATYIEALEKDGYDENTIFDANTDILTNNEVDLTKLILRIRKALAHNNYEVIDSVDPAFIKIFHENTNGELDSHFMTDNKFISYLVFKLLETVEDHLRPLIYASSFNITIDKDSLKDIENPTKGEYISYLKQYIGLTNEQIEAIYNAVSIIPYNNKDEFITRLDYLARKLLPDKLPDEVVKDFIRGYNCLSEREIDYIVEKCNTKDAYKKCFVNRNSNNPYIDQISYVSKQLEDKYYFIHSFANEIYSELCFNTVDYDRRDIDLFKNIEEDGKLYADSINSLYLLAVLQLMFVGNDQDKKRELEFADLKKYIRIDPVSINNYLNNNETIEYMSSKNREKNKYNKMKSNYEKSLEKVEAKNDEAAISKLKGLIKDAEEKIELVDKDIKKFETEYYTRHIRNAIAHGNVKFQYYYDPVFQDYWTFMYLSDYDENGNLEFTCNIDTEDLINLVFSDSYTKEVLHINKKDKTKVKDKI